MRHGRDTAVSVFVLKSPLAATHMTWTFEVKNRDPAVRRSPQGRCIYCGDPHYRQANDRKLGEEHVIADALQGNRIWNSSGALGGFCNFERDGFYRVVDDSRRGRWFWIALSNAGRAWTTRALAMLGCTTSMRFWR